MRKYVIEKYKKFLLFNRGGDIPDEYFCKDSRHICGISRIWYNSAKWHYIVHFESVMLVVFIRKCVRFCGNG